MILALCEKEKCTIKKRYSFRYVKFDGKNSPAIKTLFIKECNIVHFARGIREFPYLCMLKNHGFTKCTSNKHRMAPCRYILL